MKKNIIINKLLVVTIVFVISAMISGCATVPDRNSLSIVCSVCKKEMEHVLETSEEGKIHCKTCGSEILLGGEHRCVSCGARMKDFSVTLPF